MRIFISWSGDRSRAVAEVLHEWLPTVIQAAEPWMSSNDIEKGARWSNEVATELAGAKFGLICLTRENLVAPWILFEAGALAKTIQRTFVCPYLLDLEPTEIVGPLAQFQASRAQKEDTHALVRSINKALGDGQLAPAILDTGFERGWIELKNKLDAIPPAQGEVVPRRLDSDVIGEILGLVRFLAARSNRLDEDQQEMAKTLRLISSYVNKAGDMGDLAVAFDRVARSVEVSRNAVLLDSAAQIPPGGWPAQEGSPG